MNAISTMLTLGGAMRIIPLDNNRRAKSADKHIVYPTQPRFPSQACVHALPDDRLQRLIDDANEVRRDFCGQRADGFIPPASWMIDSAAFAYASAAEWSDNAALISRAERAYDKALAMAGE